MSENSSQPNITELNTACERINYALDRIARVGWCKGRLRAAINENTFEPDDLGGPNLDTAIAGPACLLGSLMTDAEFKDLATQIQEKGSPHVLIQKAYRCQYP